MTITKNVHLKENALLFHQFLFFSTYQYGVQSGEMTLGSMYLTLEKGSLLVTVLAELQYNKESRNEEIICFNEASLYHD